MAEELVWKEKAEQLWQLLDDIDTLGDALRPEQTPYFDAVERLHRRRHEILKSDGYVLSATENL
jgi:hypothetical protein